MNKYLVIVTDDRHHNYEPEKKVLASIDARLEIHNLSDEKEAAAILAQADGILANLFPLDCTRKASSIAVKSITVAKVLDVNRLCGYFYR